MCGVHVYIYIYIYIEREREREGRRKKAIKIDEEIVRDKVRGHLFMIEKNKVVKRIRSLRVQKRNLIQAKKERLKWRWKELDVRSIEKSL